ncbi:MULTISPECIES: DUF7311 family protein [Haloarcula]|uniref:DUF7311 family protein n=1 Tax=Haloarcula TaxID=2237 RepID=UPI0023E860A8|nr:hypothetical protein [Halomicroarcula sp. SHR3]
MMRHVVAILMLIALVAVAMPVINDAAVDRSQKNVGQELSKVQKSAESLHTEEEIGRNSEKGPQRLVELDFPEDSFTSVPVETVTIEPNHRSSTTVISYAVEGSSSREMRVDAVITGPDNGTYRLSGSERRTFVLELKRDNANQKVVRFTRLN